jgi:signal transduction histidine kinase
MKNRSSTRKLSLWTLIWLFIITLAMSLGVMQFSWINRAASNELERQQRILLSEGMGSVEKTYEELRILIPIIRTALNVSHKELASSLADWQANTSHPRLLKGLWIFMVNQEPVYITSDSVRTDLPLPESLKFTQIPQTSWNSSRIQEIAHKLGWDGMVPIDFQVETSTRGLAVLVIDTEVFFNNVLIPYLKEDLSLQSMTIVRFSSEEEMRMKMNSSVQKQELTLLIPSFLSAGIRGSRESIFYFLSEDSQLQRRLARLEETAQNPDMLRNPSQQFIAQVTLTPDSTKLSAQTTSWVLSNMILSSSILVLLVLSLAAVFYLYRRTLSVRNLEQEFTASMSHELKIPVTVIKAIGDNLSCGIVTDKNRIIQYGKEIAQKADRLQTMVEGILLYSGFQQNRKQVELSVLDTEALLAPIISDLELLEGWKDRSFSCFIQTGKVPIHIDTQKMSLIVKNLLVNAYYHGYVPEENQKPRIDLKIYRKPLRTLCIVVEDNGPGIPKNQQEAVMNPFYRLQRSKDSQTPGSGLGLHIVKRSVLLHHGKFTLESPYHTTAGTLLRGCRFIVELPIEEREDGQEDLDNRG